jgi:K(+)-stimulated pyrophosphate-energized sodium pump
VASRASLGERVTELIYETCKAYLVQQGKFLLILWAFIAVVIFVYFGA